MRLIFSPKNIDGATSLTNILIKLKSKSNIGNKIINAMVYDSKFMTEVINSLDSLYPSLDLVGNTFIQEEVLSQVTSEIYIFTDDSFDEYMTGNMYKSHYSQLIKSGCNRVYLNKQLELNTDISEDDVLEEIVNIWLKGETNMGEITDAITNAINNINSRSSESSIENKTDNLHEDRIKRAMFDIGMNAPYNDFLSEKQDETELNVETKDSQPVNQNYEDTDFEEICVKISDGNMLLMIPKDLRLDCVTVNGTEFNTLMVRVPDINIRSIQILSTVSATETKDVDTCSVVRVPIILERDEKQLNNNDDKESNETYELKRKKEELDSLIKNARKDGNESLVNELRKQRRKIRSELNKLEV